MVSIKNEVTGGSTSFLKGFVPLEQLWEGPDAPYPSEHSARWAVRKLRHELAKAQAVALHRKRLFVHPERFVAVAEQAAVDEFSARANSDLEVGA